MQCSLGTVRATSRNVAPWHSVAPLAMVALMASGVLRGIHSSPKASSVLRYGCRRNHALVGARSVASMATPIAPSAEIDKPTLTRQQRLEFQLERAWHRCACPRPRIKEVKECLAFHRATHRLLGRKHLLVDAAGGHGGVALAFKASGQIDRAIVADLYRPRGFENLRRAWTLEDSESVGNTTLSSIDAVQHQCVDLRDPNWLRALLEHEGVSPLDVIVVSCHACSVLTDELIRTCLEAQVSFAVMPCCHGEQGARGEMVRDLTQVLGVPRDITYDLMRLGVIDATPGYVARFKTIDAAITPMNHILIGVRAGPEELAKRHSNRQAALNRMAATSETPSGGRLRCSPAGQGRRNSILQMPDDDVGTSDTTVT